jgi:hypothetical protein
MPRILSVITLAVLICAVAPSLVAQGNTNFPGRRALIVNNCPHVKLSGFNYRNAYESGSMRFQQDLTWTNAGAQAIVALEVVILKYDPFDRRLIGTKWTVTGKDSADWRPLQPGQSGTDGTRGYGDEEVFTAIAYVRNARLADGTIWKANDTDLIAQLRALDTGIREFGDVKPDPKPSPAK